MSDALSAPDGRRRAAAVGGRRDRVVHMLRSGLPIIIGAMAAVMVLSPFAGRTELSFLLSKDRVDIARERMRAAGAIYQGKDSLGRPFVLTASNAVQHSSAVPVVEFDALSGTIALDDGQATITSPDGRYDMKRETMFVQGPVRVESVAGYMLETSAVTFDLKARTMRGNGAITGRTNLGVFSADRLSADLDARVIRLEGNARLRINQGVGR